MLSAKENSFLSIKKIISEWCLSTTSHGIPNIVRSENKFSSLFWSFAFLLSAAFCGYQIVLTLIDVSKFPVYTNIEIIQEMPAPFPSISFCNLNPFNTDDPDNYVILENLLAKDNINYNAHPNLVWLSVSNLVKSFVFDLSEKERQNFTFGYNQMVYSCKFNSFLCKEQDFEMFYDFDYGNCYKFNSNGTKLIGKSGHQNGLRLEIYVGNSSGKEAYTINRGIRFLVHNHSDIISINDHGQDASTGFSTEVKITRSLNEKLDEPYSTCISDLTSSYSKKTKYMNIIFNELNLKKYSNQICLNICFNLKLELECNCSDPSILSIHNMTKCISTSQIRCKEKFFQEFFSNQATECNQECPIECKTYRYSTKLSFSEFYTNWYFSLIEKSNNDFIKNLASFGSVEQLKKNVLLINFYYDDASITKIIERPLWNVFSILSTIGGNLGLFVGVSVLSIAEIVELITRLIFFNFKIIFNKNKIRFDVEDKI